MFSANSSQVSDSKLFVEDVFSTYLYTGNDSTQTITNGIDLAGKGGLVWVKQRNSGTQWHALVDSARGNNGIFSNSTQAQEVIKSSVGSPTLTMNNNGFTMNGDLYFNQSVVNWSSTSMVSWTFREAPKFFDIVTYTGNGGDLTINHSLGVQPGCIIIKKYSASGDWLVSHRYNFGGAMLKLNTTDAAFSAGIIATATTFRVFGGVAGNSDSGATYVAYLFAHDTASTGIIQCGSYTGNGSATGPIIDLGWEPQWLLIKNASGAGRNWLLFDNMRGMVVGSADAYLVPNAADAEASFNYLSPTATGFQITATDGSVNNNGQTFIYMAIRRGPMRTPTLGTSVFAPALGNSSGAGFTSGFPVDAAFIAARSITEHKFLSSRLTGTGLMDTDQTIAEYTDANNKWDYNTQYYGSALGSSWVSQMFRRAPGFMDVVCYTGTTANRTISHNLGVVPEMMIVKARNAGESWFVYSASLLATEYVNLNLTDAKTGGAATTWNSTRPTASVFSVGTSYNTNGPYNYVAYLFASCPGVSKVGSYTGNGSSQTINCAFTTGARYVLIKRTNVAGDWYVWDSARGIVAGNDPYLALNTTAAEVTSNDTIDTDSSGFVVNQVAATNVNVNAATYIYLAIA